MGESSKASSEGKETLSTSRLMAGMLCPTCPTWEITGRTRKSLVVIGGRSCPSTCWVTTAGAQLGSTPNVAPVNPPTCRRRR